MLTDQIFQYESVLSKLNEFVNVYIDNFHTIL